MHHPDVTVPGEMQGDLMQTRQNHWKSRELDEKKLQVEFSGVLLIEVSYRQCRIMIWDCVCVCLCVCV